MCIRDRYSEYNLVFISIFVVDYYKDRNMNDTLIRLNQHWSVGKYTDLHSRELLPTILEKLVLPHIHVLTGIPVSYTHLL